MAFPMDKAPLEESIGGSPPPDERASKKRKRLTGGDRPAVPTRVSGSYQRSKAPSACLVCRARKTKCDNVRPVCGFCQSTGGDCRYTESERSRFDPASVAILQQLDDIKTLLHEQGILLGQQGHRDDENGQTRRTAANKPGGHGHSTTRASSHAASGSPTEAEHVSLEESSDTSGSAQETKHELDRYATMVQTATDVPISTDVMAYATADLGIEAMLQWPVFQRQLRQLGIPGEEGLMALLDERPWDLETGAEHISKANIGDAVARLHVRELVENFLINNNLKNPILEPASLRALAEDFATSPQRHVAENCLMFVILAISCLSTPLNDSSPVRRVSIHRSEPAYALAEYYFHESQLRLGTLVFADSLLAAQCSFLTGVYLMYTMRILPAWRAFITAGSDCVSYFVAKGRVDPMPVCFGHGIRPTSCHEDGPSMSTSRALEDALYWSCLKSEIELRFELGLPGSGINAIRYPHVFPSVPDMDENRLGARRTDSSHMSPEIDRSHLTLGWFFFLAEISLKRLTYSILQNRYRFSKSIFQKQSRHEQGDSGHDNNRDAVDPSVFDTMEYDLQLEQWMQLLPPAMQFSATSTEPLGGILPWVLRGHRIDAVELLRFPAFASIMRPEYPFSRPAFCSADNGINDPVKLTREYLLNATNRIDANADGVFHRHQGSWLTIRSCTRSALALLGTKLAMQEQGQARRIPDGLLPPSWKQSVLFVKDVLRAWEPEGRDVVRLLKVVEGLLSLCNE